MTLYRRCVDPLAPMSSLLGVALIALAGRGPLAWLPPGAPGSHRPRELAPTWAASYLLGCGLLGLGACAGTLLGDPLAGWCAPEGALGLGLAVGIARLALLPGALVPRHALSRERAGPWTVALLLLALGLAGFAGLTADLDPNVGRWPMKAQALLQHDGARELDPSARGGLASPPLVTASVAATAGPAGAVSSTAARAQVLACLGAALVLCWQALGTLRRGPLGGAAAVVLLAAALAPAATVEDGDLMAAACVALSAAGSLAWTRRADGRGLALACLGAGLLPLIQAGGWIVGGALLLATLAASARPSLSRALRWSLGAALVAGAWPLALALRGVPLFDVSALEGLASQWSLGKGRQLAPWLAPVWIAAGAALGPLVLSLTRSGTPAHDEAEADRPRRDQVYLAAALALVLAGALLLVATRPDDSVSVELLLRAWSPGLLVQTAPLAALLAARGLCRAERPA
jgi:hypothetical protein